MSQDLPLTHIADRFAWHANAARENGARALALLLHLILKLIARLAELEDAPRRQPSRPGNASPRHAAARRSTPQPTYPNPTPDTQREIPRGQATPIANDTTTATDEAKPRPRTNRPSHPATLAPTKPADRTPDRACPS